MVRKWSQARTNSTISAHHPHYALPSVRLALRVWEMWSGVSLKQVLRQGPSLQGGKLLGLWFDSARLRVGEARCHHSHWSPSGPSQQARTRS